MKIVFVALGPRQNSNKEYMNDGMALNARTHFIFITLNEKPHCRARSVCGTLCLKENPVMRPSTPGVLVAQ